jgi:hypothetical protein
VTPLAVSRVATQYEDLAIETLWYPSRTLDGGRLEALIDEIDQVNLARGRPLTYGYFRRGVSAEERHAFLRSTIWSVIRRRDQPCGFVYCADLGDVAGSKVIHAGLVRFAVALGADAIIAAYAVIWSGNVRNYGPHVCTSITHLPLIAGLFDMHVNDGYPSPQGRGGGCPPEYVPALTRLRDAYIRPVLGLPAETLCGRTARLCGSMETAEGFATLWRAVPKHPDPAYTSLFESTVRFREDERGRKHICDDLVQIGRVDTRVFDVFVRSGLTEKLHTLALEGEGAPAALAPFSRLP